MLDEANKDNKKKKTKEHDSSKYVETEPTLDEAVAKDAAVITFGRMNPVTVGHEKLVTKVAAEASKRKADPFIFLSHTQDKKKNPLSYDDKIKYAQKAFGSIVKKSPAKTIIQIAQSLSGKYKNLVMVVGSDRVNEFESLLNKYNGKDFNFDSIQVVSAGERDPDADGVSGMSASKMRGFASDNDVTSFAKGLPKRIKADADAIVAAVRKGMNMSESEEIHINEMAEPELDEALNRQQRLQRSRAMRKARFKIKRGREKAMKKTASLEVLKKRARKQAIAKLKDKFAKQRRYAELSPAEKEVIDKRIEKINKKRIEQMAKKLLPVVKQAERDRRQAKFQKEEVELQEASCADTKVRKRPHMMMDANNKPKFDRRFRFFKKKADLEESAEDLLYEMHDLMEATEELAEKELKKDKDDPCWKNYVQLGTKKKNGKEVPNCVPKEEVEFEEKQLDELKKSTLQSYIKKTDDERKGKTPADFSDRKLKTRKRGGYAALDRLKGKMATKDYDKETGEVINKKYKAESVEVEEGYFSYTVDKVAAEWNAERKKAKEAKEKEAQKNKDSAAKVRKEEVELEESRYSALSPKGSRYDRKYSNRLADARARNAKARQEYEAKLRKDREDAAHKERVKAGGGTQMDLKFEQFLASLKESQQLDEVTVNYNPAKKAWITRKDPVKGKFFPPSGNTKTIVLQNAFPVVDQEAHDNGERVFAYIQGSRATKIPDGYVAKPLGFKQDANEPFFHRDDKSVLKKADYIMFNDKGATAYYKGGSVKESVELEERATSDVIKTAIGKMFNKRNYKAALEYMKKTGKSAADVARIYKGVDARELAAMAESTLDEKLKASDDMGKWIDDFQDSDAPQFKGKSKEKKRQMAIAAKLDAERNEEAGAGEEGTDKLVNRYKKDTPNA